MKELVALEKLEELVGSDIKAPNNQAETQAESYKFANDVNIEEGGFPHAKYLSMLEAMEKTFEQYFGSMIC